MKNWMPINGYEGIYEISSDGVIKSLERRVRHSNDGYTRIVKERILTNSINTAGYYSAMLSKENSFSRKMIHRLVAEAFIPNPENKPCVNHIDGDKLNNSATNLEWCTYSENELHSLKIGLRYKGINNPLSKPIICRNIITNEEQVFGSQNEAASSLNLYQGNILKVLKNKYKQTKGYTFSYANS